VIRVAILVDGGYYLKGCNRLFRELSDFRKHDAIQAAAIFHHLTTGHIHEEAGEYLYRILYYDGEPLQKSVHHTLTNRLIKFGNSETARFRREFFERLKHQRKVALRLGTSKDHAGWISRPGQTKKLLKGEMTLNDLTEEDVTYDITQKGVDMKIGLDIASLAYKRLVDKIVLISGSTVPHPDQIPDSITALLEGSPNE
jgi:uncharacterized LabA/DUF88 family protein